MFSELLEGGDTSFHARRSYSVDAERKSFEGWLRSLFRRPIQLLGDKLATITTQNQNLEYSLP